MYLIHKPGGRKGYYSFSRLIKEESIKTYCFKTGEEVPTKDNLPVRIAHNQILIEEIEIDERI